MNAAWWEPTEEEISVVSDERHRDVSSDYIARAVLALAGPRIVAAAYREAARELREVVARRRVEGRFPDATEAVEAVAYELEVSAIEAEKGVPS